MTESSLDGDDLAREFYGPPRDDQPRCSNCGKAHHNGDDIGCTKCDPRARRAGMAGPVPTPPTDSDNQ
jgi:hypothetical protein